MDSPNRTTNRNGGSQLATECVLVKLRSDCPQPRWNSATTTPWAAANDSTVRPEISTERPEVAAATSIASRTGRPAARSSRCRRGDHVLGLPVLAGRLTGVGQLKRSGQVAGLHS